jgi:hypothetical protein
MSGDCEGGRERLRETVQVVLPFVKMREMG